MPKAKKDAAEPIVVRPAMPGWLMISEIAKLAGTTDSTIRGYRLNKQAGFPEAASRAGTTPLWTVDSIVAWLASRQTSRTTVLQSDDGSLVVTEPSAYPARYVHLRRDHADAKA